MLDQKTFDLIRECYTASDHAALEAAKKYADGRIHAEILRLIGRIEALEKSAASMEAETRKDWEAIFCA